MSMLIPENYAWCLGYFVSSLSSALVCFNIQKHFNQKCEVLVNVTDLISADRSLAYTIPTLLTSIVFIVRLLVGEFSTTVAEFLSFIIIWAWGVTALYVPALCIARHLLIFHYHWLNTILDRDIQIFVRIATLMGSLLSLGLARMIHSDVIHTRMFYFFVGEKNDDELARYSKILASLIITGTFTAIMVHVYTELQIVKMRLADHSAKSKTV